MESRSRDVGTESHSHGMTSRIPQLLPLATSLCLAFWVTLLAASEPTPQLVTERGFGAHRISGGGRLRPRSDLRTDFVMAYGVDPSLTDRLAQWRRPATCRT